ncbi:MAG: hypothetical protein U0640_05455 [Phycisphaerales bacterium]
MLKRLLVLFGLLTLLTGCGTSNAYVAPPLGNPAVCELHHVQMKWDQVRILYDEPNPAYWKKNERFPHTAGNAPRQGCVINVKKSWWAWVCNQCTEAHMEWETDWRTRHNK